MQRIKSFSLVNEISQFRWFLLAGSCCLVLLHFNILILSFDKTCSWSVTCYRFAYILSSHGRYSGLTLFCEHPREKGGISDSYWLPTDTPDSANCHMRYEAAPLIYCVDMFQQMLEYDIYFSIIYYITFIKNIWYYFFK